MRLIMLFGVAVLTCQAVATSFSGPAIARSSPEDKKARKRAEQEAIRLAVARGEVLPMPRLLAIAREKVAGEVVEVEFEAKKRSIVYEVKILTPSGRVREVELDARTGALIEIEND